MIKMKTAVMLVSFTIIIIACIGFKVVLGTCTKDDLRLFPSPMNDHEASLFVSSCGATVSNYTDVEIDKKRVFSVKYPHMEETNVYWQNNNELIIEYSGNKDDLFMYKEFYKDFHIVLKYVDKIANE